MRGARLGWRLVRAALALAIASPLGCTLLLDATTEPGPHCNFWGRDSSACGLCLATRCQAPIDACCGDASCQAALDVLDHCAGDADVDACRALHDGTAPVPEAVSMCARASCAVECTGGQSVTNCSSGSDFCDCTIGEDDPNDEACTDTSIAGGVCCADMGYPDRDLSCSCSLYACLQTADGCSCEVGGAGSLGSCTGPICCLDSNQCHCGSTPCLTYVEQRVTACTQDTATCADIYERVTTCSRTTP